MLQKTTQDSIIEQQVSKEVLPSQENTIAQESISGALVQETTGNAKPLPSQEVNPSPEDITPSVDTTNGESIK